MYSSKQKISLENRYGFTLIELMFVIVILGVLASIVLGQFRDMTGDAGRSAFMTSGRIFTEAAMRFQLDTGDYPEDAASGVLPLGFGDYVQANRFEGGTPLGGVWDSEYDSFGIISAIGVHFGHPVTPVRKRTASGWQGQASACPWELNARLTSPACFAGPCLARRTRASA